MQYIKWLADYKGSGRTAVTFGKFDGLHRGHQKLISKVHELGEKEHISSVVCAFDMTPLWKEKNIVPQLLMVGEERYEHVKTDVDYLIECPFTESFRQVSAEDFIEKIIYQLFHAKYVVVGTDFNFGCEKRGDVKMLAEYADKYDYQLIVIEKERYKDRIISSTYVKEVVKEGNVGLAETLLGYPYTVEGVVEHGKKLGRTLGFPTLNIAWPENKLVPAHGVYLCRVQIDGEEYPGIANIGIKPTVTEEKRLLIESFLFGYSGNAYGKSAKIELVEFRRPERKFAGVKELKEQIDGDIARGKEYFGIA
ncbi:riboflavin biosynthesis protein RibF [Dorea sp.]|nr:riboflavin biosynthesis protein RibF [uncultured Dorea sp.]